MWTSYVILIVNNIYNNLENIIRWQIKLKSSYIFLMYLITSQIIHIFKIKNASFVDIEYFRMRNTLFD